MISLYYGPVVNPKTLIHFDPLPRCLISVEENGNIKWIEDDVPESDLYKTIAAHGLKEGEYHLVDFTSKPCEFLMPGFVDSHVHPCQFPIMGIGGDLELLEWLKTFVFPTELMFKDEAYAKPVYEDVVERSIASGTTTSSYFSSLFLNTTITLAEIVHEKGQRAIIGKCNMDFESPGCYIDESAEKSIQDTIDLMEFIETLPPSLCGERLVHPAVAPRFLLSSSDELLEKLHDFVERFPDLVIHTHISENRKEIEECFKRFGTFSNAEVCAKFGLLRKNTILAHGVWLTDEDMNWIQKSGAGVAHCPASNFYLSSGMAEVGSMLDHGITVGIGTDVSGGNNPSMLYAVQMASTTSKMVAVQAELDKERGLEDNKAKAEVARCAALHGLPEERGGRDGPNCPKPGPLPVFTDKKLRTAALLYLATLGGASVCSLSERIGSFEEGKAFDALYVSLDDACGNPAVWGRMRNEEERQATKENIEIWVERFLFGGDGRNVRKVWVQGVVIGGVDGGVDAK